MYFGAIKLAAMLITALIVNHKVNSEMSFPSCVITHSGAVVTNTNMADIATMVIQALNINSLLVSIGLKRLRSNIWPE